MKTDRIVTLLASSIMLTAVSAIITHYAVTISRDRVQWVFHTYTVMEKTDELLSAVLNMQQEQQRYLISDDSLHRASYNNTVSEVESEVHKGSKFTVEFPV